MKAFRILGLDERKGRWVVEQDFRGIVGSKLHGFCLILQPPCLNHANSGMV